ncbi:MAG: Txe/YoeB family addiction module toxin [bacterium]
MSDFAAVFHDNFRENLRFWVKVDRKIVIKILEIVEATLRQPFEGLGKPEPLKHHFSGAWSRRITQEHRLVYRVTKDQIIFLSCRYHFKQ